MIKIKYEEDIYYINKDKIIDISCYEDDEEYFIDIYLVEENTINLEIVSYDKYKYILNQIESGLLK